MSWQGRSVIVAVSLAGPDEAAATLGLPSPDRYMVEYRVQEQGAPEGSVVRRRTTPFVLTAGTGGLPDATWLERNGVRPGAEFPVRVSEAISPLGARCGSVQIRFEGLR
ncbi:MAG: hypothetical protein V3573_01415 [Desulfovibrionaceae bacterium]